MTAFEVALRDLAHQFRQTRGRSASQPILSSADDSIDRLLAWSVQHQMALDVRGPEGKDPAFGVTPSNKIATVWRIYPRQPEGGKVTLLSKAEHLLTSAERESVVGVLEALEPSRTIEPGQRLEIGLARLGGEQAWARFASLLPLALRVAQRHGDSARSA
ncbi:MAG: hypothetical protein IPF87_10560 [Gemmatimonadetes bacterium]|nr:hypothetical protein [Gemmatimonadota bacterium]